MTETVGRRTVLGAMAAAGLLLTGCTATADPDRGPEPLASAGGEGVRGIQAQAAVRSIYPMLETIIVEYAGDVVLPDAPPEGLFSFADSEGGRAERQITAVYTNDALDVREDEASVPGRYVIVQLEPVANPEFDSPGAWMPESTAGRAIVREGQWAMKFRTDYSGVEVRQAFDAQSPNGVVVQPAGVLPELPWENVTWPDLAGFTIDEVYESSQRAIRYSFSLPEDYDPSRTYPLMVSMPGYGGQLLSDGPETRGVNVFTDRNALAWAQTDEAMIVLAPQPATTGGVAVPQTIELVEHFLDEYAIDPSRVYALGYSGGGETMSAVLGTRADLFAAYVHASSRWSGEIDAVIANQVPVHVFMAESDEYYGSETARRDASALSERYAAEGLSPEQVARLVRLTVPGDGYFARHGIDYFHVGGQVVSDDAAIVDWMLAQRRR